MTTKGKGARTAMTAALVGLAAGFAAPAAARAEVLTFRAALDGKSGAEATGSAATGSARIKVDTVSRRVSVDLAVRGITVEALWDKLVAAPIGPVHFHKYASAASRTSVLVLPLPYGADYRATRTGMRLRMEDFDYGARAGLLRPALPFDDFVAALRSGLVVLNVHTDAFNPGEIGGPVLEDRGRRARSRPASRRAGSPPAGRPRTAPAVAFEEPAAPRASTPAVGTAPPAGREHGAGHAHAPDSAV